MKKLWQILGITTYWLTLPGIWLVLRKTRRTRLVIESENQIVVVKPWLGNGKWSLPGGGIHRGESAINGAIREAYEEVGITVALNDCTDYGVRLYHQNGLKFSYQLFGTVQALRSKIRKQPIEIIEARWVNTRELSTVNSNQDVLVALQKCLK